jgi:hypothetical protein
MESATINYKERLEALIRRRNVDLSDIKYKGRLRTSKWNMYIAMPKSKLLDYLSL